jgi:hypothetical protein
MSEKDGVEPRLVERLPSPTGGAAAAGLKSRSARPCRLSISWATKDCEPVDAEVVGQCAAQLPASTHKLVQLVVPAESCKHRLDYVVNERHALLVGHSTVDLKAVSVGYVEVTERQLPAKIAETVAQFRGSKALRPRDYTLEASVAGSAWLLVYFGSARHFITPELPVGDHSFRLKVGDESLGKVLKVIAPEADLTQDDAAASTPQMESLLWSISQVCTLVQQHQITSVPAAADLLARLRKFRADPNFEQVDDGRKSMVKECVQALNGWVNRKEHFLEWKKHLSDMKNDMLTLDDGIENQERAWALAHYLSQDTEILASLPADNRNAMCQVLLSLDAKILFKKLGFVLKHRIITVLLKAVYLGTGTRDGEDEASGARIFSSSQTKQLKLLMDRYHRAPVMDDERNDYDGRRGWYPTGTPTPPTRGIQQLVPPTPDTPFYRDYSYPPPMPPVPGMPLDLYLSMGNYDFNAMSQFMGPMGMMQGMPHPDMPVGEDGHMLSVSELEQHLEQHEMFQHFPEQFLQEQFYNMGFPSHGDPNVTALLRRLGLEKYESTLADAEIDWDGLVQCKEQDLADLGMPKGARIKVRQALRDWGSAPGVGAGAGRGGAKGSRKGKGFQYSLTPVVPGTDQEPPLPVGGGRCPTGKTPKA